MAFKDVIVTEKNYKVGDKVVRGRDWDYSEQDRDAKYGTIRSTHSFIDGRVMVDWTNGHSNSYAVGQREKFDLYFYTGKLTKSLMNRIGHLLK